jgi:hypothetical protein
LGLNINCNVKCKASLNRNKNLAKNDTILIINFNIYNKSRLKRNIFLKVFCISVNSYRAKCIGAVNNIAFELASHVLFRLSYSCLGKNFENLFIFLVLNYNLISFGYFKLNSISIQGSKPLAIDDANPQK